MGTTPLAGLDVFGGETRRCTARRTSRGWRQGFLVRASPAYEPHGGVDLVHAAFEPHLENHPQLAPLRAPPIPALCLYAGHNPHDVCPLACAGVALDMPTCLPEREVSSPTASGPSRGPIRSDGGCACVRRSPVCARGRTTRDILHAQGRARAPRLSSGSGRRARAPRLAASVRRPSRIVLGLYSVLVSVMSVNGRAVGVCCLNADILQVYLE